MFSVHLFKKLLSTNSIHIHHYPNSFRSFGNFNLSCYSTSSLVNVNDLTKSVRKRNKKSVEEIDVEKSFTVSYLINSLGFSHEKALVVSGKVRFTDSEKPNSVLALFKSYGFSDTQIASIVRRCPKILVKRERSISPKLDFFLSIGMSKDYLGTFISKNPMCLHGSLNTLIIPNYNFLKSILLTDEMVITVMKYMLFYCHLVLEKRLAPNITALREFGVPESSIRLLLTHHPNALVFRSNVFKESISKVLEMGFDPLKTTFVLAIRGVSGANKAVWDRCYETYSSWGWSEEDIRIAYRKHPNCMMLSRNNISRTMDYLVNKMGFNAKLIAQTPSVIFLSLDRRIIPRLSVIQLLLSKGLIERFSLIGVMSPAEEKFLDRFVVPYEGEIPELYDFYRGKIGATK